MTSPLNRPIAHDIIDLEEEEEEVTVVHSNDSLHQLANNASEEIQKVRTRIEFAGRWSVYEGNDVLRFLEYGQRSGKKRLVPVALMEDNAARLVKICPVEYVRKRNGQFRGKRRDKACDYCTKNDTVCCHVSFVDVSMNQGNFGEESESLRWRIEKREVSEDVPRMRTTDLTD